MQRVVRRMRFYYLSHPISFRRARFLAGGGAAENCSCVAPRVHLSARDVMGPARRFRIVGCVYHIWSASQHLLTGVGRFAP